MHGFAPLSLPSSSFPTSVASLSCGDGVRKSGAVLLGHFTSGLVGPRVIAILSGNQHQHSAFPGHGTGHRHQDNSGTAGVGQSGQQKTRLERLQRRRESRSLARCTGEMGEGSNGFSSQIPLYSLPNILTYSEVFSQYKRIFTYSERPEYAPRCASVFRRIPWYSRIRLRYVSNTTEYISAIHVLLSHRNMG